MDNSAKPEIPLNTSQPQLREPFVVILSLPLACLRRHNKRHERTSLPLRSHFGFFSFPSFPRKNRYRARQFIESQKEQKLSKESNGEQCRAVRDVLGAFQRSFGSAARISRL